ncbi:MAG TPA: FkbM family methyltransferase [Thermoanaerobaculia bacterium]|nr:FkbM family methyltransferase [Thermoanaerobaculia bacterium]
MLRNLTDLAQTFLARYNLQVRRLPAPLIRQRDAELRPSLAHAIAHHLMSHQPADFFFVQVGAYDGVTNDPLHSFVTRFHWRGILLEPQAEAFAALTATYRDEPQLILRRAAVADADGHRPLYTIRRGAPGLPTWAPQLASFRRETLLAHRDVIPGIGALIATEEVACVTFDTLLAPFPGLTIDLLQIDAEGADFEIIKLFHQGGRRARIVHFEHKHLSPREHADCAAFLIERGYSVGLANGDSIALLDARS